MLTLGSLFDGICGFPLAFSRNGFVPLWASEIEPFPIKVTTLRFPDMKHLGDITKINGAEIEPVDVVCGGSPCQDLSVAGRRAGLAGARSGLYMEQIRIIREMREYSRVKADKAADRAAAIRPRFMVWENVPGAFSSKGLENKLRTGEAFNIILEEICRINDQTVVIPEPPKGKWPTTGCIVGDGYSIAWRVLDAQYWGVPQRRRRIFLVADFGGESAAEILFKREGLRRYSQKGRETREGIAGDAACGVGTAGGAMNPWDSQSARIYPDNGTWHSLNANEGGGQSRDAVLTSVLPFDTTQITSKGNYSRPKYGDPCHPLAAGAHPPALVAAFRNGNSAQAVDCRHDRLEPTSGTLQCGSSGSHSFHSMNPVMVMTHGLGNTEVWPEVAMPVMARDYKGPRNYYDGGLQGTAVSNYAVRRLTPLECERLQGFPDGWTDIPGASDSARYKALGNSVAIPCVEYVAEGIAEAMRA